MARAASRTRSSAAPKPPRVSLEYESVDIPPRYVEGVQGLVTAKGAVQIYFYSDYVVPPATLEAKTRLREADADGVSVDMRIEDPYGIQGGDVRMVRRVEANLVLSAAALRDLNTWTGQILKQIEIQASQQQPT